MKKLMLTSFFSICCGLLVATGWLLVNPAPVMADEATCKADCGNGHTVTCSGPNCAQQDRVGCTSTPDGPAKSCNNSSDWDKPEIF